MTGVRTYALSPSVMARAVMGKGSTKVSVCIPCRNEAATIGPIVSQIVSALMSGDVPMVDELLVFDDGSTDATASVAAAAGARVIRVSDVLAEAGPGSGKGNVLWASVAASDGDVIVWCDGDLLSFVPDYVLRLVAPFLLDPEVAFVKGYYERLLDASGEGGGRNTELVARPLLALLFPELAGVLQPLGGEYAARRSVLEQVPFAEGYGVEIGLLIDVAAIVGSGAIVQVDLGVRRHRHRPLPELSAQAGEIMHAMLRRAGLRVDRLPPVASLARVDRADQLLRVSERPPLLSVAAYVNR